MQQMISLSFHGNTGQNVQCAKKGNLGLVSEKKSGWLFTSQTLASFMSSSSSLENPSKSIHNPLNLSQLRLFIWMICHNYVPSMFCQILVTWPWSLSHSLLSILVCSFPYHVKELIQICWKRTFPVVSPAKCPLPLFPWIDALAPPKTNTNMQTKLKKKGRGVIASWITEYFF